MRSKRAAHSGYEISAACQNALFPLSIQSFLWYNYKENVNFTTSSGYLTLWVTMKNYKILGLDSLATWDEVKAAYRALAMKYHPDRNPGDATAEAKFKEIQKAYDILEERKFLFTPKLDALRSQKPKKPEAHEPEQEQESE